jgi:hypothetical protein
MNNPEILATLGTQDTGQTQSKKNNTTKKQKMSNTDPSKTGDEPPPCAREG